MNSVEWAYAFFGVTEADSFEHINRRIRQAEMTTTISQKFRYAKDIVLAVSRHHHFGDDSDYTSKYMLSVTDQTPFQNLLLFLLRRLSESKYRRHGDSCFEQIETDDGRRTFAFARVCSIKEFVMRETRKESDPEQWKNVTNPRDNLDNVCRHLSEVEHAEFASIEIDPMLISWANGT